MQKDPTTFPADRLPLWYNATDQQLKGRLGSQTMVFVMHQESSLFMQMPKLNEYLQFVIWASLIFGLCFELPMVMLVLAQIGMVDAAGFRGVRRYAIFGITIFTAIALPTGDIVSMIALVLPMVGLYELGILLAALVGKKKARQDAADAESA